ncbi:hypothetical protein AGOR_G00068300 [Albula goreensis]|uniref:PH domain-containing protein n=1 Tax=Albula goreensis TaxID=1534307 RepID=A0A8T3DRR2_9TELE|nr:hypothetical protein AGOR_G00068300 [Albula goreensis]
MEVPAKEGMMHLQVVKFGKKTWRRAWAILFPPSLTGIGRLELYNMRDGGVGDQGPAYKQALKGTDKRLIRLDDCLSISLAPEEACPRDCSAFYLNTTQRTYTLAAPAPHDWMPIICQHAFQRKDRSPALRNRDHSPEPSMSENELYSSWSSGEFQVSVQWTEAAARCNLVGPYLLSVSRRRSRCRTPARPSPSTAGPIGCSVALDRTRTL